MKHLFLIAPLLGACSNDNDKALDLETAAILTVKDETDAQLDALVTAAEAFQEAAPDAAGWAAGDLEGMERSWKQARVAYERIEGAIAVLFPNLDAATDERYDGFLAEGADADLFDAEGVIGVHALERIVWAGRHPDWVVAFEENLPGYAPAAFPATDVDATRLRTSLAQRLVDDTRTMRDSFAPLALDTPAAFRGVIGSMAEQYEKCLLAQTGEDESRYAQHTLADMRANLAGGQATYAAFQPWLLATDGGAAIDADVLAGFARVDAAYAALAGEAIPTVPSTWNPDAPSAEDLATGYGQLWTLLSFEADPTQEGSLVGAMLAAADLLGIPQIPE